MNILKICLTHWRWSCGDGCCSDSGTNVSCTYNDKVIYAKEGGCRSIDFRYFPAYIVDDIIGNLPNAPQYQKRREKFCNAVGYNRAYDGKWFWTQDIPCLSEGKIRAAIAAFYSDISVELIEETECEDEDTENDY